MKEWHDLNDHTTPFLFQRIPLELNVLSIPPFSSHSLNLLLPVNPENISRAPQSHALKPRSFTAVQFLVIPYKLRYQGVSRDCPI